MPAITLILTVLSLAQGSGSVATPPSVNGSDGAPFQVTKSITGVVKELASDGSSFAVEDPKKKLVLELKRIEKTRVAGGTLAVGAAVRVNYANNSKTALDIRVLGGERK